MTCGFTLAEVLITLAIIGIVAALTISTLVINYQKQTTVVKLKEAYAIFSQVVKYSVYDNGNPEKWDIPHVYDLSNFSKYEQAAEKYFLPYLNGVVQLDKRNYTIYSLSDCKEDCTRFFWDFFGIPKYLMKNGMIFAIYGFTDFATGLKHISVLVDLNGQKKPNMLGVDVFAFWIYDNSSNLEPYGTTCSRDILVGNRKVIHCSNRYYSGGGEVCSRINSTDKRYAGVLCSALIQADGWKISDDYPW